MNAALIRGRRLYRGGANTSRSLLRLIKGSQSQTTTIRSAHTASIQYTENRHSSVRSPQPWKILAFIYGSLQIANLVIEGNSRADNVA